VFVWSFDEPALSGVTGWYARFTGRVPGKVSA
jgi:hypothetical protein